MIRLLSFLVLFLGACASKPVALPEGPRTLLFPYGTYQHLVKLKLTKAPPKGPQSFEFRGVFAFSKEKMKLAALTPFGTTLFRAEEDFTTGEVKIEAYVDALKKVEDKIKQSYMATREILTLPISEAGKRGLRIEEKNQDQLPVKMTLQGGEGNPVGIAQIQVRDYDQSQIPRLIKVENADFHLEVKVISYEF